MAQYFPRLSAVRQTAIMTAIATLLSFFVVGTINYIIIGPSKEFWNSLAFAFLVPWMIAAPLGWILAKQNERLVKMTDRLRKTKAQLRETNRKLEHKANIDGLTGLVSREHFMKLFEERHKSSATSIFMIIDADHFKKINDGYGHLVGDKALILLASAFKRLQRKGDLVGRIGGEEFGLFLPDTSEAEGEVIAEMIRREIESTRFEPQEGAAYPMTVSMGLTTTGPFDDRARVLRDADTALFEAKKRGRNQYVLYTSGMQAKPRPFYEAAQSKPPHLKRA